MSSLKNKKIALVYDRVNKWGGAERILLALHRLFPKAPLYTSVYNHNTAEWANGFTINTSFLQKIPYASGNHEMLPLFMPVTFESFNFDRFDIVISITSEAAKGIITKPDTKHICYCLTPTRYLWSGYNNYFSNPIFRYFSIPAISYLRRWDKIAAQRPDVYISISNEVKSRIKRYYNRDSVVVYPPLLLSGFNKIQNKTNKHLNQNEDKSDLISFRIKGFKPEGEFFLIVSRLVAYKKIDIAIQACNELKVPLYIVGIGNEEKKLKSLSGPTIKFLGAVSDYELEQLYSSCSALIFPSDEDLGLVILEAQSFGKPVIAYKSGGALETVIEDRTGIFFSPQTADALKSKLINYNKLKFDNKSMRNQAEKFSLTNFENNFIKTVESLL